MKRALLLIACLSLLNSLAEAQYSRYIITFKNKNGSSFTLANPSLYLSAKSIARRTRQHISLDSTDLPIIKAFIDSIISVPNVKIINRSNWLNQVCISTTSPSSLAAINAFSFVKSSAPIAFRTIPLPLKDIQKDLEEAVPSSRINRTSSVLANTFNYGNTLNQVHIHNGEYLHNQGFAGEGMTIAILDAGFFGYKTNPVFDSARLQNRILGEWDFVANEQSVNEDDTHGMYCFSIIGANRPGLMVGTAPKANFYLFRTEDGGSEYPIEEQNWAAAAERADSLGVDMISSSLGYSDFSDPSFDHSYSERDGNTSIVTRAADLAAKKGIIVMNSAGNTGTSTNDLKYIICPADGDSVVTVGAVDANGTIVGFSSWGPNGAGKRKPNIVSIGQATTIAGTNGQPATGNGTSYANPNIAGLIASFWQAFPEVGNMDLVDAVQKSSNKYNTPDNRYGYGIPDFKKAFAILVQKSFSGTISNSNCINSFNWTGKDDRSMKYIIERKAGADTGYTPISSLTGNSVNFALHNYNFKDTLKYAAPVSVSYRLKQILPGDSVLILMDTTINVATTCSTNSSITFSPNPFNNSIRVTINTTEAISKLGIALYNVKGQRLYSFEGSKPAGTFSQIIPGNRLPNGVYVVTVRDNLRIILSERMIK